MAKRGAHDMGGNAAGPIDTHEHTPTLAERRIDAMMQLLRAKPRAFWRTDENRRTIESLEPDTYDAAGYYERWTLAMRGLLIEKGVLTEAEIAARLAEVKARLGVGDATAEPGAKAAAAKPARKAAAAAAAGKAGPKARKAAAKPATGPSAKSTAKPKSKAGPKLKPKAGTTKAKGGR